MREATRIEDMSTRGRLRVMQQEDGDIIVAVQSEENGRLQRGESVEFCTIGPGGGRSQHTLAALRALMVAIEKDNAERPISADDARRSIPQGDDPAKAAAQGDELPPLPWDDSPDMRDEKITVTVGTLSGAMREYGAACRAGEKSEQKADAWMVGLDVFKFLVDAERNVRNPELQPIPLYRRVSAGEKADARDAARYRKIRAKVADDYLSFRKMDASRLDAIVDKVLTIDAALSAQKGGEDEGSKAA